MQNKFLKKITSIFLIFSILFSFSFIFTFSAATKSGIITEDAVRIRTSPTTLKNNTLTHNGSNILLYKGHEVTILETVNSPDDTTYPTWCRVKFKYSSKEYEGYVYSGFVREKAQDVTGGIMPGGVPKIYEEYIKKLVNAHPNWNFVFYNTGIDWSNLFAEDAQGYVGRSVVQSIFPISYRSTQSGAYNWRTDSWISQDSGGWYQANEQTLAYFLDPRNFLNETNVFMFESLKYDSGTHNLTGVETILNGSFMDDKEIQKTNGEKVKYSQAYLDAAAASGVSPYHLSSRTLQEVGANGSGSTSGTYSGYVGYYNFYNINASAGNNPIANGLKYAKGESVSSSEKQKYDLPWNSQYKAIVGGAKWIGNGYINMDQDTLYYQKFNVVNRVWSHQYMTNIMAPQKESETIYNSYKKLGILDQSYTFIIPYYNNMPEKACKLPVDSNHSPNNWLNSLKIDNYSFGFDAGKTSGYSLTIPGSVSSVNISAKTVNSKASVSGTGKVSLAEGSNTVKVVVTAQNGDKRTYTIEIIRSAENKIPLKSITLDKKELSMFNGDSHTLTVNYNPSNTTDSKTVTWTSSDSSVATVKDGNVIAIGKGEATITAKVGSFTATCKVTVSNNVTVGDIDADGAVTIADALMIFKYKTNEIILSSSALKAADTDKNGKVELADALKIFKYKSGEIDSL